MKDLRDLKPLTVQEEAARKKLEQKRMLDEQLASSRHPSSASQRATPDTHSTTTSARLHTASRAEEAREKEVEGDEKREGQERYRADLDRQVRRYYVCI